MSASDKQKLELDPQAQEVALKVLALLEPFTRGTKLRLLRAAIVFYGLELEIDVAGDAQRSLLQLAEADRAALARKLDRTRAQLLQLAQAVAVLCPGIWANPELRAAGVNPDQLTRALNLADEVIEIAETHDGNGGTR